MSIEDWGRDGGNDESNHMSYLANKFECHGGPRVVPVDAAMRVGIVLLGMWLGLVTWPPPVARAGSK